MLNKANSTSLADPTYLHSLLQKREIKLFTTLGKKMAAAGKAGTFSSWMFEESDLIQHAAKAFGDRLIADRMSLAVAEADEEMKPILNLINTLYMATIMEKNISWFVISGILKNEDINQMKSISADLCPTWPSGAGYLRELRYHRHHAFCSNRLGLGGVQQL